MSSCCCSPISFSTKHPDTVVTHFWSTKPCLATMSTYMRICLIDRLPNEIWQHIFAYIYPSFHLRYTQTHDHFPQSTWQQVLESVNLHDLHSLALPVPTHHRSINRFHPSSLPKRSAKMGITTSYMFRRTIVLGRRLKRVHGVYRTVESGEAIARPDSHG